MNTKEKFIMMVSNTLLIKLRMCGIDPTEASMFFGNQANLMLDCKANYGPTSTKVTNAKAHQLKKPVWLMRGFFPETPQMFKISISTNDAYDHSYEYFVKVSEPKINPPTRKKANGHREIAVTKNNESQFTSNILRDQLQERMEKEVLDLDLKLDSLVDKKVVFTPKCISPKGMPLFRLNYKKG